MPSLFASTSSAMAGSVASAGMSNRGNMLGEMLKGAAAWKPQGYDQEIARRRDYYLGNQAKWLRGYLAKVYPQQAARMVPYVVGLFRFIADQKATVYRANPTRVLMTGDQPDEAASKQLSDLYNASRVNAQMQRVESIAAACKLCFVRVGVDQFAERIELSPRWPDTVHVIPHPDWPTSLPRALALIAETTSEAGVSPQAGQRRYEVWQRFDEQWQYSVMQADGASLVPAEFDGQTLFDHLPWVAVRFEDVEEAAYPMPSADDIEVQDAINAVTTDMLWGIKNTAWPQITYSGTNPDQKLVGGGGTVWIAGEDGAFNVLPFNPPISEVRDVMKELVGRYQVLHNLPPSTASADQTWETGVALKVKNQPRDEARLARVPIYRELEQRELWPIMRSQSESLGMSWPADAELAWYQGELALPVDDVQEWNLSKDHVSSGVSTWPEEMVRLRLAPNVEAAAAKYEANTEAEGDSGKQTGVEETALNGAQISSMKDIVIAVSLGELPRDAGLGMLRIALQLTEQEAAAIMGSAGAGFEPKAQEAPAPQPPQLQEAPPQEPPEDDGAL